MKDFSEQQKAGVLTTDSPVLLLAVPGGGKTTVLVTRLGYMIYCCGVKPEQILTLTYTVAATRDMAARFRQIFEKEMPAQPDPVFDSYPGASSVPEFRTINGICAKIILFYGRMIGKTAFELETDEKKLTRLTGEIYRKIHDSYATESEIKNIRTLIAYIKNMMLSDEEILELDEKSDYRISLIYQEYCRALREQKRMDYDDQMIYAETILRHSPQTLSRFQSLYPYICVDEAQDTSRIQHKIIRLLAGKKANIFMVGDEDQSIYAFRAAYPQALLDFEKDYPGGKVLLMELNYRSGGKIVTAADRFISKNIQRHKKQMRPCRTDDSAIRVIDMKGRGGQYTYLAKAAKDCRGQTAVLFRDNESALPLIDLLERQQIPYRYRNAELSFFTNRVVLDIENILRFALNPRDTDLFMQIYYKVSTYLTKQAALEACRIAEQQNLPVPDAALRSRNLSVAARKGCLALKENLNLLRRESASEAVNRIGYTMGYRSYLERAGVSDKKLYILSALARATNRADDFLNRLDELERIVGEKDHDPSCSFILSTIHSSKGLEYDTVYLMDVADGLFPETIPPAAVRKGKCRSTEERETLSVWEEERRLFYVGVTRAKNNLILFRLPEGSVFIRDLTEPGRKKAPGKAGRTAKEVINGMSMGMNPLRDRREYAHFLDQLAEGVLVSHAMFGEGVVKHLTGERVTIVFSVGEKTLDTRILFERGLLVPL